MAGHWRTEVNKGTNGATVIVCYDGQHLRIDIESEDNTCFLVPHTPHACTCALLSRSDQKRASTPHSAVCETELESKLDPQRQELAKHYWLLLIWANLPTLFYGDVAELPGKQGG